MPWNTSGTKIRVGNVLSKCDARVSKPYRRRQPLIVEHTSTREPGPYPLRSLPVSRSTGHTVGYKTYVTDQNPKMSGTTTSACFASDGPTSSNQLVCAADKKAGVTSKTHHIHLVVRSNTLVSALVLVSRRRRDRVRDVRLARLGIGLRRTAFALVIYGDTVSLSVLHLLGQNRFKHSPLAIVCYSYTLRVYPVRQTTCIVLTQAGRPGTARRCQVEASRWPLTQPVLDRGVSRLL